MLAIEINNTTLQTTDRAIPTPSKFEVLIKVQASGVNRLDIMQCKGLYHPPPDASDIPGLEISGKIVSVGSHVNHLKKGDKACALVTGGGYAEYCIAHMDLCLPIPHGLNYTQAAALPETFFTVWSNVFDRAQLTENESILIHGGSSGIGTTAIQLAKAFFATVYVTTSSEEKCDFCTQLGADAAINYKQ